MNFLHSSVCNIYRKIRGNSVKNFDFFKLIISVSGWPLSLLALAAKILSNATKPSAWFISFQVIIYLVSLITGC